MEIKDINKIIKDINKIIKNLPDNLKNGTSSDLKEILNPNISKPIDPTSLTINSIKNRAAQMDSQELLGRIQVMKPDITNYSKDFKWCKVNSIDKKYISVNNFTKLHLNDFLESFPIYDNHTSVFYKNPKFNKSVSNQISKISATAKDSDDNLIKTIKSHLNKISLSRSQLGKVIEHDTKFAVTSKNGIQGCHVTDFYDELLLLAENSTPENPANITAYINENVADINRFREALAVKNVDGTLNLTFKRKNGQVLDICDLQKFQSKENPNLFLFSYSYKDKHGIKTTCDKDVLNKVFTKIDEHIESETPIDILSPFKRDSMDLSPNGIFKIEHKNDSFFFFICDSTIFPVQIDNIIETHFPQYADSETAKKIIKFLIPVLK